MLDLENALISLRFANLTITAEYLRDDMICFHLRGKPHIYDLSSGIIVDWNWELENQRIRSVILKYLNEHCVDPESVYNSMDDHEKACLYHELTRSKYQAKQIDFELIAFIVTLANRQVKGDELIKGLKASNYEIPRGIKIIKNYTGGWIFQHVNADEVEYLSVEQVTNLLMNKFDS